ncbi:hypothetical protein [Sphaerothrix gracilis]|uniref:hypothetical protein n=1 Tax=Sphaerothrix gracilis TaxID=3151835 RepID=UPI0031FC3814
MPRAIVIAIRLEHELTIACSLGKYSLPQNMAYGKKSLRSQLNATLKVTSRRA